LPPYFARFTALRLVLEVLFVIKQLFTCGEDEIRPAVDTFQSPILKVWHGTILGKKGEALAIRSACWFIGLFDFPATFLPVSFARERLLDSQFFTRFQIERVAFDLFNDVFLLHLPFETPEGVFQCFTVLESYFSQNLRHLQTNHRFNTDKHRQITATCQGTDII
jgi:hypothetical protein